MYIEVIPLDASIDAAGLTYFVSDELRLDFSVGSLVEIPLRNSLVPAIVARLDTEVSESMEHIRSIVSIICGAPLLAAYELETTLFLAARYFVHAHKVLSLFLSRSLLKYLEKKSFIQLTKAPVERKSPESPQIPRFIHCTEHMDIQEVIHTYIQKSDTLAIVFPDDFSLDGYLSRFAEDSDTMLVIRDGITDTQKYKRFIDVYNGEKKIII